MTGFTDPIPSDGRLIRAVRRQAEHAANAKRLERIARETGGKLEKPATTKFEFPDPTDIRGIPATGRGISGTIRGTQPESRAVGDS